MNESKILYETGNYWVMKHQGLFVVYKNGLTNKLTNVSARTHSTSVDDVGYTDLSIAKVRANYLAKRESK